MGLLNRIKSMLSRGQVEAKAFGGQSIFVGGMTHASVTRASRTGYATEGYNANAVVHRCVSLLASNFGSAPLVGYAGDRMLDENHPLMVLMRRPNMIQGQAAFLGSVVANYQLFGNAFIERLMIGSLPRELWPWPPYQMSVKSGKGRMPTAYKWTGYGSDKSWQFDAVTGQCDMLLWRTYNPLSDQVGMSPLQAAAYEVDQHNQAGAWNFSLLKNSAMPSGVLTTEGDLTDPQRRQIKDELKRSKTGADNARSVMVLSGGLQWQQITINPTDMDWLRGRDAAARYISSVLGVPDQLVPIPGAQTFANYAEARLSFWEETVLPLLESLLDEFNIWLCPAFGDNIRLVVDTDSIPALEPRRAARWTAVQGATWLTPNEKREATGYDRYNDPGADLLWMPTGVLPISDAAAPPEPIPTPFQETQDSDEDDEDDDDDEEAQE